MLHAHLWHRLRTSTFILCFMGATWLADGQAAKPITPQTPIRTSSPDYAKARSDWFYRGRIVRGRSSKDSSAELRRRAYESKIETRSRHAAESVSSPADQLQP